MNKVGMTPIVATALLLVIAVISVVGFQSWFNTFSTSTLSGVESQGNGNVIATVPKTVIGNQLYFNNGYNDNLTVSKVTIGGNDCNFTGSLSNGLSNLSLSNNCTQNLASSVSEVVIYTDKGIFSSKMKISSVNTNSSGSGGSTPSCDLELSSVVALLQFDDGTTRDYTANTSWSLQGGAIISDVSPFSDGGKALRPNNLGSTLGTEGSTRSSTSSPFILPGDFTIEMWIYHFADSSSNIAALIFDTAGDYNQADGGYWIYGRGGNSYELFAKASGGTVVSTGALTFDANRWYHLALTRDGTNVSIFWNGTRMDSTTDANTFGADSLVHLGNYPGGGYRHEGYIDDFRITKGVARYTEDFVVPSESFSNESCS